MSGEKFLRARTANPNRPMQLPAAPMVVHPLSSEIFPPSSCIMGLAHPRENPMRLWSQVFVFTMLGATFALGPASAHAQNVRVRGTIEQVEGNNLVVKSRDGAELKLVLKETVRIGGVVRASLSDIKPDTNVAITSRPRADGTHEAVEVRVSAAGQPFNSFHDESKKKKKKT